MELVTPKGIALYYENSVTDEEGTLILRLPDHVFEASLGQLLDFVVSRGEDTVATFRLTLPSSSQSGENLSAARDAVGLDSIFGESPLSVALGGESHRTLDSEAQGGIIAFCISSCSASTQIIGCDGRAQGPTTSTAGNSPWQMVGRFTGTGIGGCSGTLIGPKHVLTAAHCLVNSSGNFRNGTIGFRLGQFNAGPCSRPYGTHWATRAFVPLAYDGGSISATNKALDWAVVELANPIPGATSMDYQYLSWGTMSGKTPFSVGYPGDKPTGTIWETGGGNHFISGSYQWLNGGDKGLMYVTNDAVGGQSGSPIYVFHGGVRKLVGVFIGAPVSQCQLGRSWASRLTTGTSTRITNATLYPPNGNVLDFSLRIRTLPGGQIPADNAPCN